MSVQERVAALRGFAALGYHKAKAAKILGISRNAVGKLCKRYGIEMKSLNVVYEITLKRAAAMREFSALDRTAEQAAILLQIDRARVSEIRKRFGISFKDGRKSKPGWLQERILRDFGKAGLSPSVMALRYGTSGNSVSVRMSELRKEGKLPPLQQRC